MIPDSFNSVLANTNLGYIKVNHDECVALP